MTGLDVVDGLTHISVSNEQQLIKSFFGNFDSLSINNSF
jgi:hypothetical protein